MVKLLKNDGQDDESSDGKPFTVRRASVITARNQRIQTDFDTNNEWGSSN